MDEKDGTALKGTHLLFIRRLRNRSTGEEGKRIFDVTQEDVVITPVVADDLVDHGSYYSFTEVVCKTSRAYRKGDKILDNMVLKPNIVRIIAKDLHVKEAS